eukprot:CAMPEP_0171034636 /NCGR_PEP_ID=MMETSP0736-20130129/39983_1 /TAXON_ID=186038 /ORGANISM="Fragilariopsis kerguelensis, Strain L26-C5" /LENGTH=58 /DNA_ID=CAMNT_0011478375 /DNA_START=59 /DNA_END=232 /DNA_ORIENTATION=+
MTEQRLSMVVFAQLAVFFPAFFDVDYRNNQLRQSRSFQALFTQHTHSAFTYKILSYMI